MVKNIAGILITLGFFVFLLNPAELVQKFTKAQETCPTPQTEEIQKQTAAVFMSQETLEEAKKTIEKLEKKIAELESQKNKTEIKTIIKEVPVEKIVIKEVAAECNLEAPRILSAEITQSSNAVSIKWETDRMTKSKILISGGNISGQKEYPSIFSIATGHRANILDLLPYAAYRYEIQATAVKSGKELGTTTKQGEFYITNPESTE